MTVKIGLIVGIPLLLLIIWLIWRRKKCIRKIRCMGEKEKCELLNSLTLPFGFGYEPRQEIFISDHNAWQRGQGYEALFDKLASKFHMVIDAFPVYFNYQNKTWLIEFWKGQYGINTGAEIGVYHTNRPIPEHYRKQVHYNAVNDEEMPYISMCLEKKCKKLFFVKDFHWWLAAFKMGMFSQPKDLILHATITFDDCSAVQAFVCGLEEAGFSRKTYCVQNTTVCLLIDQTNIYTGIQKLHRCLIQFFNRCLCALYRIVTKPFTNTADRLLFLYEQLPWCFRRILQIHAYGKKPGRKTKT